MGLKQTTTTAAAKFRLIDLFCGCGGLTQGFEETGRFELVFANDFDGAALDRFRANFDPTGARSTSQNIVEPVESNADVPAADVVVGGPPCKGFSLLNRNRIGDKRRESKRSRTIFNFAGTSRKSLGKSETPYRFA